MRGAKVKGKKRVQKGEGGEGVGGGGWGGVVGGGGGGRGEGLRAGANRWLGHPGSVLNLKKTFSKLQDTRVQRLPSKSVNTYTASGVCGWPCCPQRLLHSSGRLLTLRVLVSASRKPE